MSDSAVLPGDLAVSPVELLGRSFEGVSPRLRAAVVDYLWVGADVGFPSALRDPERAELAAIPAPLRADFYLALEELDRADDLLLVRLGRLLDASSTRYDLPGGVPASIWALLDDARQAVFHAWGRSRPFTTLPIDRLRALLALEGVMPAGLDGMIIDLLIGSSRNNGEYGPSWLQTFPGTAEFAAAHADVVAARAASFGPLAHLELARLASTHPPLAVAIAGVLIARTTASTAGERSAALAAIASIPADIQVAEYTALLGRVPARSRVRVIPSIERIPDFAAARGVLQDELRDVSGTYAAELKRAIERLSIFAESGASADPGIPDFEPLPENPLDPDTVASISDALVAHRDRLLERLPGLREARAEHDRTDGTPTRGELDFTEREIAEAEGTIAELPRIVSYLSGEGDHRGGGF